MNDVIASRRSYLLAAKQSQYPSRRLLRAKNKSALAMTLFFEMYSRKNIIKEIHANNN